LISYEAVAQVLPATCNTQITAQQTTQRGGRYIPASGSLNVLFVYVQFPDDNYQPANPNWPVGQAPVYMNSTVDQTWSVNATPGSITDYFNQMSINTLMITGTAVSVITPHTKQWYLNNSKSRWFIHSEVLQQLDATMDFAPYDNWKWNSEYNLINSSDGIVDMIFMMWRYIDDNASIRNTLELKPGGEASLGYGNSFTVDNGTKTVYMGHPYFGIQGSGLTAINPVGGDLDIDPLWTYARHEFGHWLLGGNEYHTMLGTWGLLNGWGTPSGCMNSFERERLGWINFNTINYTDYPNPTTITSLTLPDFITTGTAYRLNIPGGGTNEYYLLENHQRLSAFDIPDNNVTTAKGVFVLKQSSSVGSSVGIVSADGKFDWTVPYQLPNIYGGTGNLPVFQRGSSDRLSGYSKREAIPWTWQNVPQSSQAIHYFLDPHTDEIRQAGVNGQGTIFTGDGKDQFDLNNNNIFTPTSNPSSDIHNNTNKIGLEITGVSNGTYTFTMYINTVVNASPSKPQNLVTSSTVSGSTSLTWSTNLEPNIVGYNIYRGVIYTGSGEPTYTKINSTPITTTTYTDNNYESIAGLPQNIDLYHRYRITAVDNQNKESVQSEYFDAYFTHIACGTISSNRTWKIDVKVD
jgi:M6 family metalloprotease-like protein